MCAGGPPAVAELKRRRENGARKGIFLYLGTVLQQFCPDRAVHWKMKNMRENPSMDGDAGHCETSCFSSFIRGIENGNPPTASNFMRLSHLSPDNAIKLTEVLKYPMCLAAPRPAAPAEAAPPVPSPAAAVVSATAKKELVQAKRREDELTVRLAAMEAELTTLRNSHGGAQDQIAELSDRLMVHSLLPALHPLLVECLNNNTCNTCVVNNCAALSSLIMDQHFAHHSYWSLETSSCQNSAAHRNVHCTWAGK